MRASHDIGRHLSKIDEFPPINHWRGYIRMRVWRSQSGCEGSCDQRSNGPGRAMIDHRRSPQSEEEPASRFFLLSISSAAFACSIVATFAGQWITGTQAGVGLAGADLAELSMWRSGLLITLPMFALLYLERRSSFICLRDLWDLSGELLGPIVARVTIAELVVVSLFAGIGEELLFRGFLQSWLGGHGLLLALILPNVLFGLLHWISPGYAVCTFCVGLYFSCLLHFADSVNLPALMIAHSLYDLVVLLCLRREVRQRSAAV